MDDPVDLRGLKCPLPAMLARKALAKLSPQTLLTVLADDPMALVDIPHMCHREGHALKSVTRHQTHAEFHIRAGVTPEAAAPAEEEARPLRAEPAEPHPAPGGGSPRQR